MAALAAGHCQVLGLLRDRVALHRPALHPLALIVEAAVARAIALSHERYCSATIMLSQTATVTTSHEIVEG